MKQVVKSIEEMVINDFHQAINLMEKRKWSLAIVSLEKAYGRLNILGDERLKYQVLYHLMVAYLYFDSVDSNSLIEKCFQEIKSLKIVDYTLQPEILRIRGIGLTRMGKFQEGIKVFLQLAQLPRENGRILAWAYLSEIYLLQYQWTEIKTINLAKHYGFKILDLTTQKPHLMKEMVWALHQLGHICLAEKQYYEALQYFIDLIKVTQQPKERYRFYLDLAEVYLNIDQIPKALKYLQETEIFFKRQKDNLGLANTYYLRGRYLFCQGFKKEGSALMHEALKLYNNSQEQCRFLTILKKQLQLYYKECIIDNFELNLEYDLRWLLRAYFLENIYFD